MNRLGVVKFVGSLPSTFAVLTLGFIGAAAPMNASLVATATVIPSQVNATTFHYDLVLTDTGTTTIGTFWFSWIPGQGYLPDSPTNIVSPPSWTAAITDGPLPGNGFSIRWVASNAAADLTPGNSLAGFSFEGPSTPAQLAGISSIHPPTPVLTSFVYSAGPFSDAGFRFVSAETPEPSSIFLTALGCAFLTIACCYRRQRIER